MDTNVRLDVIDYGGSGPPLVLLAGLGNTAHVFDRIAPKLIDQFHVYAITRRRHGARACRLRVITLIDSRTTFSKCSPR